MVTSSIGPMTRAAWTHSAESYLEQQFSSDTRFDQWEIVNKDTPADKATQVLAGLPAGVADTYEQVAADPDDGSSASVASLTVQGKPVYVVAGEDDSSAFMDVYNSAGKELMVGSAEPDRQTGRLSWTWNK